MVAAGRFTGQFWNVREFEGRRGFVSLHTDFRGENLRLEGHAGRGEVFPKLVAAGPFAGQMWRLTPIASVRPAAATSFGTGCRGRGGVPSIQATGSSLPWSGETFRGEIRNVPNGATALLLVGPRLRSPLDLAFIRSPGCLLRVDIDTSLTVPVANGVSRYSFRVPTTANLIGQVADTQGAVIDPARGSNDPLVATTGGLALRIGLR